MLYQEFFDELTALSDAEYRDFHKRLLKNDKIKVLGVRVPQLRKLAKKYKNSLQTLMGFPDEYYEVTFVKLAAASYLGYSELLKYIDKCVSLMDNWATCDCFAPVCVGSHKDEFLSYIEKFISEDKEFYQRFALTTLLHFYVEEKYTHVIISTLKRADTSYYYVHMAAAWLIAELLIKQYSVGEAFLKENVAAGFMDAKTHNKAIQKACESFRLSGDRKNYLKGIKR